MWFAIVFMFRAFGSAGVPNDALHFWYAENEGELPDNNFVFEAGNGQGIGGSIRNYLPRSLSVGDHFSIIPVNEPFSLANEGYRTILDFVLSEGDTTVEVLPVGFKASSIQDYLEGAQG